MLTMLSNKARLQTEIHYLLKNFQNYLIYHFSPNLHCCCSVDGEVISPILDRSNVMLINAHLLEDTFENTQWRKVKQMQPM